jgi:hypothetical protein
VQLRPAAFAAYSARSACPISSSVDASPPALATPAEQLAPAGTAARSRLERRGRHRCVVQAGYAEAEQHRRNQAPPESDTVRAEGDADD